MSIVSAVLSESFYFVGYTTWKYREASWHVQHWSWSSVKKTSVPVTGPSNLPSCSELHRHG